MRRSALHTVEVELTRDESWILQELAALRGQSTAEFVRDALRVGPLARKTREEIIADPGPRHLQVVSSSPPSAAADRPGCA